jgi:hypothetical protein
MIVENACRTYCARRGDSGLSDRWAVGGDHPPKEFRPVVARLSILRWLKDRPDSQEASVFAPVVCNELTTLWLRPMFVHDLIPSKGKLIFDCLRSIACYWDLRLLMDSSAGREDRQNQIGLDVEAATGDTLWPI